MSSARILICIIPERNNKNKIVLGWRGKGKKKKKEKQEAVKKKGNGGEKGIKENNFIYFPFYSNPDIWEKFKLVKFRVMDL